MARPKGAKNKSVKEKVSEVMEEVAKQHERSTDPVERKELAEAVDELSDVIGLGEATGEAPSIETFPAGTVVDSEDIFADTPIKAKPKKAPTGKTLVGVHPVSGEAVYR